ncbi:MAG: TetR/AcrR family transcriptional regulator [Chitinophagaceae bacterium]|nr:TetR/AcrR family transcriptional regulator [Chitinophagaceae bacterium]
MGVTERRQRQKEEVKASILTTAWQMVKEEGWQSLSIRKIADAIEYSVPVIYDHFENKEAILMEFSREGFLLLSKKVEKARDKYTKPEEQLIAMIDAYWNFAFKNREYYQLMYGLGMPCCECEEVEKLIPGFVELQTSMMSIIEKLIKGKKLEDTLCFKYHTLWSIVHGLISITLMRKTTLSDNMNKKVLDDAVAGFIKNLG